MQHTRVQCSALQCSVLQYNTLVCPKGVKGGCGCRRSEAGHTTWLEPAKQKCDSQFVDDVSSLLGRHGLLVLFPTFITFWAVFFQMFSTFENQVQARHALPCQPQSCCRRVTWT